MSILQLADVVILDNNLSPLSRVMKFYGAVSEIKSKQAFQRICGQQRKWKKIQPKAAIYKKLYMFPGSVSPTTYRYLLVAGTFHI